MNDQLSRAPEFDSEGSCVSVAMGQKKHHRVAIAPLAIAVLIATQGCAMQQHARVVSSLTLEEAKSEAQSAEDDIASLIPAQSVTHMEQMPTGGLLSCNAKSAYQWYGKTVVDLRAGVDVQAILDEVVDKWKADKSFSVSRRTDFSKARIVQLDGQYDSTFFVRIAKESHHVSIASYSQCFILPKGADPDEQY
jgi:hypothetical protein